MSSIGTRRRFEPLAWGSILALYIIGLIIFYPKIQYPFGDTWFYSHNVNDSLESGRITFAQAQAAMPVFQVWIGKLICNITGGFSFFKLNLLTYFFSFLAALYTYRFIRLFTKGQALALMGTLLLIGLPPFFKTSLAFMTDVYFYFGLIFALYHGAKYILADDTGGRYHKVSALLAAIGFGIAILSRTNALLTYIAFLIYVCINHRKLKLGWITWLIHLLPLVAFILLQMMDTPFQAKLVQHIFLKTLFVSLTTSEIFTFVGTRISSLAKWAGYFGAVMLPVTLWIFIRSARKWRGGEEGKIQPREGRLIWFVLLPIVLVTAAILMYTRPGAIVLPNTITPYGMGVKDSILPGAQPLFGEDFFSILKFFISIGGILLILAAIGRILERIEPPSGGTFLWWMLISTAVFPFLTDIFSDRYLIPMLPLLFALMAGGADVKKALPRWTWVFPVILIAGSGLLANEYFGWNTALWKTIPQPVDELWMPYTIQYEAGDIDGGLEYTAFRYYHDEHFLDAAIARAGGSVDPRYPDDPPGIYPWYVLSLSLPRQYDIYVREDSGDAPYASGAIMDCEWEIIRSSEYKPFPWSKPRGFAAYAYRGKAEELTD